MKKGTRFQTKLLLTMVVMVTAVTMALLAATERKIREAYTRQFEGEFQELMDHMVESRKARAEESLTLGSTLASDPYILSILRGDEDDEQLWREFWNVYVTTIRKSTELGSAAKPVFNENDEKVLRSSRGPGINLVGGIDSLINRIGAIATMDTQGEVTLIPDPFSKNENMPKNGGTQHNRWRRFNYDLAREEIEVFMKDDSQHILYIAPDPVQPSTLGVSSAGLKAKASGNKLELRRNQTPIVQEMISTPVTDPETGEMLGLFLRGTSAETDAQRFIERYQSTMDSKDPLKSGIYLNGEVLSRSLDHKFASELAQVVEAIIGEEYREDRFRWEGEIGSMRHAVYIAPLTDADTPWPAFEVAAFSLTKLNSDLAELRIRGSGIGLIVLLFSALMAWLLSRNLSIPLRELVRGTKAIREGTLGYRVEVRSRDEIGELASAFNEMAEDLKQKDLYRDLLGKVSDETVAQALVSGSLDLELGGELKNVSVLFCDIRGFTAMTEHMDPTQVIEMVNSHMTAMTQIVQTHFGVVDKFVGDEIMAVFGGLKSYGNDAANAAACALQMIRVRKELNREVEIPVDIGVGVATGEAIAGCMGSTDRLNFTVLGARVNLAARLCDAASAMTAVIDLDTLEALGDNTTAEALPDLELKGFSQTWTAFHLKDPASDPDSPERKAVMAD